MRRAATVLALMAGTALFVPAVANAQEPEQPVANCGFLSAVVCQVPVNIGPFGPFTFFPNGLGSPTPPLPTP